MTNHHGGPAHSGRQFPYISVRGDDGRTHQRPLIICAECGARETCVRNGSQEADEIFRRKGWAVGKNSSRDYCPMCVKAKTEKKVVKMEEHVNGNKPAPVADTSVMANVMTKEDGRILSRLIEDRWDEAAGRYQPGWSDAKLADDCGKPVEWVKQRRELDFGGVGEDPGVLDFIAQQTTLAGELDGLRLMMSELAGSVSEMGSMQERVQRTLEKYRDAHNTLANKVNRLQELAKGLRPFDEHREAS